MTARPPLLPFTEQTARQKVQAAEDAWNTRDPRQVALACTQDSAWRNRGTFVTGRDQIVAFLTQKWERELDYALRKELWAFDGNRIAVRFRDHGEYPSSLPVPGAWPGGNAGQLSAHAAFAQVGGEIDERHGVGLGFPAVPGGG